MFLLLDKKTSNIMGEHETLDGVREQFQRLVAADPSVARDLIVLNRNRPSDMNMLAQRIVHEATTTTQDQGHSIEKNPAAVALGRKGGLKGGKARAAKMTPEERSEAARKAANARWHPYE